MNSELEDKKIKLNEIIENISKSKSKLIKSSKIFNKVFLTSLIALLIEVFIFILTGFGASISYPNLVEITSLIFLISVDTSLIINNKIKKKIKKIETDLKFYTEQLNDTNDGLKSSKENISDGVVNSLENTNVMNINKTLVKTYKSGEK